MAIPKLKKSRHHSSDEILKLHYIIYLLRGMGYDIDDARSVIKESPRYIPWGFVLLVVNSPCCGDFSIVG